VRTIQVSEIFIFISDLYLPLNYQFLYIALIVALFLAPDE